MKYQTKLIKQRREVRVHRVEGKRPATVKRHEFRTVPR